MEAHKRESKLKVLLKVLKGYESVLVAYSGGVDSTFLLACAKKALNGNAMAVTARSPVHPKEDLSFAKAMAKELGVRHVVVDTDELKDEAFKANTLERCYYCKKEMFKKIIRIAHEEGIRVVAHGVTLDDLSDYRPGIRAAEELGILSPLVEVGFAKKDVRANLRSMGIVGWDKPASPCLATRIPYGQEITLEKLGQVKKGERFLRSMGHKIVRVRNWNGLAVLEVEPSRIQEVVDLSRNGELLDVFKKIGFQSVALDLEGYRMGKLNRFRRQRSEGSTKVDK